ncbi:MAG TPA: divalent metal cation transporter [Ktedonobacterales bacterium]|jgi:NRAMP (natural resistance-associated macrophage protein)-like metal ion transporter
MSAGGEDRQRNTSGSAGEPDSPDSHRNSQSQNGDADEIEPGMPVEAREGDLGKSDISTARVKDVERNAAGDVTNVVVEKGVIFRKTLDVPAERVETVEEAAEPSLSPHESEQNAPASESNEGKVILNTTKQEVRDLSATGSETLDSQQPQDAQGAGRGGRQQGKSGVSPTNGHAAAEDIEPGDYLRTLGPGVLSGMAGNDSSAVTSYSVNGATNGYGQLWLILLATPLYQSVQYACAKIGRVTQMGLADILRKHYGRKIAIPASLILVVANTALIAADLVAIGTGIQLLTGIAWEWFVVPVAVGLWYLIVYQSFGIIKKIFLAMSFVFVAYLITGVVSGAQWGDVLRATFVPHLSLGLASISSAVALLGATVSPYTMYWQVQGEKEQKRPGTRTQQFRLAALDIAVGTIAGNLVAYAIIVCTAATLFTHHKEIQTAADAAAALAPLLGPYAAQLFAIGFIGSGMIAIPVLLASTSYGLSGLFGWSASLWKKPWQSEGFYLIMTGALVVSLIVALLRFDPIQLMFWANVLQGTLSPVLIVFLLLVGNNRKIMRSYRLRPITNVGLALTALVMGAATILLFYGLLSGGGA